MGRNWAPPVRYWLYHQQFGVVVFLHFLSVRLWFVIVRDRAFASRSTILLSFMVTLGAEKATKKKHRERRESRVIRPNLGVSCFSHPLWSLPLVVAFGRGFIIRLSTKIITTLDFFLFVYVVFFSTFCCYWVLVRRLASPSVPHPFTFLIGFGSNETRREI